jgi:hypothetical protein
MFYNQVIVHFEVSWVLVRIREIKEILYVFPIIKRTQLNNFFF